MVMEAAIESAVDRTLAQPGVKGVLCSDAQGLCLSARNELSSSQSGFVTSIAVRAANLEPGQPSPAVTIESDRFNVLVRQHGDFTLAVKKESS